MTYFFLIPVIKKYISLLKICKNKSGIVKYCQHNDPKIRRAAVFSLIDLLVEENDPEAINLILECVRDGVIPRNRAFSMISTLTSGPRSSEAMNNLRERRENVLSIVFPGSKYPFLSGISANNLPKTMKKMDENIIGVDLINPADLAESTIEMYHLSGEVFRNWRKDHPPRFDN